MAFGGVHHGDGLQTPGDAATISQLPTEIDRFESERSGVRLTPLQHSQLGKIGQENPERPLVTVIPHERHHLLEQVGGGGMIALLQRRVPHHSQRQGERLASVLLVPRGEGDAMRVGRQRGRTFEVAGVRFENGVDSEQVRL